MCNNVYNNFCRSISILSTVCFLVQDPFNMGVNVGPWGTKDKPRLVPSMFDNRIVGCICEFGL